jgi:hypothetical protein
MDMMMVRESAAQTWNFWYKYPHEGSYTQGSNPSNARVFDSWITAYSGWSVVSLRGAASSYTFIPSHCETALLQAEWRVGLVGGNGESTRSAVTTFDYFITGNGTLFQERQAWMAYWINRNATLAQSGLCAISRSVERTVGSSEFQYLARDLVAGERYRCVHATCGGGGGGGLVFAVPVPERRRFFVSLAPICSASRPLARGGREACALHSCQAAHTHGSR